MIRFERTQNLEIVRALITAPHSWEFATDDTAPPIEKWRPSGDERIYYILALDERGAIGLYTFVPQNSVCYEIHVTRAFGSRALAAGRAVIPWAFEHLPTCRRIVASIVATNLHAIRYAERCRFRRYGLNPRSFLRGGKLVDQVLLGISPEDIETKEVL